MLKAVLMILGSCVTRAISSESAHQHVCMYACMYVNAHVCMYVYMLPTKQSIMHMHQDKNKQTTNIKTGTHMHIVCALRRPECQLVR
jgi:hypothetical protein